MKHTHSNAHRLAKRLLFLRGLGHVCMVVLASLLASCNGKEDLSPIAKESLPVEAAANIAYVNVLGAQQLIDGFGGSTAWSGQLSDGEANSLFSNGNNQQMGLSIIRLRIDPNNNWNDEKVNAQKAKARGAKVFATPWTPPASMKTNNNLVGGYLNTGQYANYANWLKSFCTNLGNVDAISIQNEPNIAVDYESCFWNASQLLNFVKNNAAAIGKPIVMPEAYNFAFSFSDPTLNDATAASKVTYIGGHIYGTSIQKYTNALNKGKRTWMTEHYHNGSDIGTAMTVAKEIHDCMTVANHSAYVWWTLKIFDCAVLQNGALNKKGYVLGHYAKFVRPGYRRADATYNPQPNVYVSAYKGTKVVVVAINMGTSNVTQPFLIQNSTVTSVNPYVTSSTKSMVQGTAISVSGGAFTATLPAQSITTFVQN